MWIVIKSAGDDFSFTSTYVEDTVGHSYEYAKGMAEEMTKAMKAFKSKKWSCIYTLESITDFYADDDFEDAIREVTGDSDDLSQRIRITVEKVE